MVKKIMNKFTVAAGANLIKKTCSAKREFMKALRKMEGTVQPFPI